MSKLDFNKIKPGSFNGQLVTQINIPLKGEDGTAEFPLVSFPKFQEKFNEIAKTNPTKAAVAAFPLRTQFDLADKETLAEVAKMKALIPTKASTAKKASGTKANNTKTSTTKKKTKSTTTKTATNKKDSEEPKNE